MIPSDAIQRQLAFALERTDWPELGALYRGKVRDVYRKDGELWIVTTDRVSAFDHVLGTIPWKGEILNAIAVENFEQTRDIVPNHLIAVPDPSVLRVRALDAYPLEVVVRGYLTGSLWRDYTAGTAGAYGVPLPAGMRKDQRFAAPILTPSTKAELGKHDEPISREQILARGLMRAAELEQVESVALRLFERGSEAADRRGLILVDTKYEFGRDTSGALVLIDEIHTPDSSRYWIADGYSARFARGEPQQMLDKENLRQWLIQRHGFSGQGRPPPLDDAIRVQLAEQYIALHEQLLGRAFVAEPGDTRARIAKNLGLARF
jgi:phosphoribosylaminoimidazole-succinocarboxamide synthase